MTALARETERRSQDTNWQHFYKPLPLEDGVKAWKGGLAGLYVSGGTAGEVAPFKTTGTMIGLGKFTETVDNADDGELVKIEGGVFVWTNGASGDAFVKGDIGKFGYGLDDDVVGKLAYVATTDPVINTVTPTTANDTLFALRIRYKLPGESLWRTTVLTYLSDGSSSATEQCDGLRADLLTRDELDDVIVGTGTDTLILTGAEGVQFDTAQAGPGILTVDVTEAGTITEKSKAGVLMDLTDKGPAILSHPAVYAGLIL